ncbi:MAG: hypothetical protein ACYDCS_04160 [Candidatus Dormibacteria bacterium]
MADVAELLLLLRGDASGAKHAISDVKGGLSGLESSAHKTGGVFRALGSVIVSALSFAAGGVALAVASGVKAYSDIEDAQAKLTAAMKDAGPKYTQNQAGINKTTLALNHLGLGTADALTGMAQLTTAHVPLAQQQATLTAVMNLSAVSGMGFAESLKAILMGAQGAGRELKQYGINLPAPIATTLQLEAAQKKLGAAQDAVNTAEKKYGDQSKEAVKARVTLTTAQTNLNAVTESYRNKMQNMPGIVSNVNQQMGGQALAKTHTFSGALNQLKIGWDTVAAGIGAKVVPYLDKFAQWISAHEPQIADFVNGVLAAMGVALGDIGDAIGFIIQHQTLFKITAGIVAGMFVIGHAQAWATDAIQHVGNVVSALKNAPAAVAKLFGIGGGSSSAIGAKVANLAGDVQKVYVVNMGVGGLGGGAGPAAVGAEGGVGADAAGAGVGVGTLAIAGGALLAAALLIQSTIKTNVHQTGGVTTGVSTSGGFLGIGNSSGGFFGHGGLFGTGLGSNSQIIAYQNAVIAKNLANAAAAVGMSVQHFLAFKQASQDLANSTTDTGAKLGVDFVSLEGHLQGMGLSFTQAASASDALQAYVTKYGPLSSAQIQTFYNDISRGVTSAFDIALSLQTANENLSSIPSSSASIASSLASLHKSIPGSVKQTGGGLGYSRALGGKIYEDVVGVGLKTGRRWNFHQNETVHAAGEPQGGDVTHVNVFNPHSTVDVTQAIDQQKWLQRMARRGAHPSAWPAT